MSKSKERRSPFWSGSGATALLLILGCVGFALLAKGLYPVDLPSTKNPNLVDTVFDNRGVLWAARIILVSAAAGLGFGGVFIVVSLGAHMKHRLKTSTYDL